MAAAHSRQLCWGSPLLLLRRRRPAQPASAPPPPPSTAALAAILGRFRVSVAPRMGSREDVRAAETMKLTLQCAEGMHLRLEAR